MSRGLVLRPEAEADLASAYRWYDAQRRGLGDEFLLAVEASLSTIERFPESYLVVHKSVRRALLRRFPYGVFYVVDASSISVIAVFHASRSSEGWQERM